MKTHRDTAKLSKQSGNVKIQGRGFVAFPVRGDVRWGRNRTRDPQECGQGHLKHQNRVEITRFGYGGHWPHT